MSIERTVDWAQRRIDSEFRRLDNLERMERKMDKDNFEFFIGSHPVVMTTGVLTVDGTTFNEDDDPAYYAMAQRIAFEAGCFQDDDGIPAVTFTVT